MAMSNLQKLISYSEELREYLYGMNDTKDKEDKLYFLDEIQSIISDIINKFDEYKEEL